MDSSDPDIFPIHFHLKNLHRGIHTGRGAEIREMIRIYAQNIVHDKRLNRKLRLPRAAFQVPGAFPGHVDSRALVCYNNTV